MTDTPDHPKEGALPSGRRTKPGVSKVGRDPRPAEDPQQSMLSGQFPVSGNSGGIPSMPGDPSDTPRRTFEEAGSSVRRDLKAIERITYAMRLASFRTYLTVAMRSMPVLVPPMLEATGTHVAAILQLLRPVRNWQHHAGIDDDSCPPVPKGPSFASLVGRSRPVLGKVDRYRHPSRVGDAIVSDGGPAGWIEAVASGRHLEIVSTLPDFDLLTLAGMVRLKIREELPDTVIVACPGSRIDRIVAHPLLGGEGFVVERAWLEDRGTVLEFTCPTLPLELPWRD